MGVLRRKWILFNSWHSTMNVQYRRFVYHFIVFFVLIVFIMQLYFHTHNLPIAHHTYYTVKLQSLNSTLKDLNSELRALLNENKINTETKQLKVEINDPSYVPLLNTDSGHNTVIKKQVPKKVKPKKALLFTMDSISSYEENSLKGGAAGELLIRHSLEEAFQFYNIKLDVLKSDKEFQSVNANNYDIIILDPWTWAAKGWVPKEVIKGQDKKIYILDFFGSEKLRGSGLNIPNNRFLTAYGSPWNTFLGYYMDELNFDNITKKNQGVIWGKDVKHFEGKVELLKKIADSTKLVSTATMPVFNHQNIQWYGHKSRNEWMKLLAESKFLLGLGDPLLGPSAIDCISVGCVYINPIYNEPVRNNAYSSQHSYAAKTIGNPHVCSYHIENFAELQNCVDKAMKTDLVQFIPADFVKSNYFNRVKEIFSL